jgi:glucosamine-6-phosphate deaminase
MDEYVGLSAAHPASFRHYLQTHLLSQISIGEFHPILGETPDSEAECQRYAALIDAAPIDLICLGIGENGHLAFNDPPVANFHDVMSAKVVELDPICRQQQVNDGCFPDLNAVPKKAITLTLPVFRNARNLSVVVPGPRKAAAVYATCAGPVHTDCPASLLRTRPNATLFLDRAAAERLPG